MRGTQGAPWGGKSGESAGQGAPQVVGGSAMAARKSRTAESQNLLDVSSRHAARQQSARYPQVHDAPVRLRKSLHDMPAPHAALVDLGCLRAGQAPWRSPPFQQSQRRCTGTRSVVVWGGWRASDLQESFGLARQTGSRVHDFHPRRIAVGLAAVGLLIGETGEPAQMTPVRTGTIAAIKMRQMPAHLGSEGRFQGSGTDMHPSLPMARAGLDDHTRLMPISPHRRQRRGIGVIQVDENEAGIPVLRIGVDVHIASLAVTHPQKADGREVGQLTGSPQPFSGKRPLGRIVNQTDEIKVAGHGRQLAADGLRGERQTEIEHAPNSGIELGCRTMNCQRAVNSVLTHCLSQGAHSNPMLKSFIVVYTIASEIFAFCLMSSPPGGNVHVASDNDHYEDLNDRFDCCSTGH